MNTYFITGTDTDCGKTYVTCQLLSYLQRHQQRALAIKPVASGCSLQKNGQLQSEDVLRLQSYNYDKTKSICGWQFAPPISPHLAAKKAKTTLSAQAIKDFCLHKQFSEYDYLLIEGAGGLLVPLNEKETWLDFLALMQVGIILVVGMRLGSLNHALLTDEVIVANKLPYVGWIANCIDNTMLELEENIATLSSRMKRPLLASIAYQSEINDHSLSRYF